MRKIILLMLLLVTPELCSAGAIGDALVNFVESGKAPECKDLKIKMRDLQKQYKEVEAEYNNKCVIDGTVDMNQNLKTESSDDDSVPVKCEDGTSPDEHGCCTGESFKQMADGAKACCPETGDCFSPIK